MKANKFQSANILYQEISSRDTFWMKNNDTHIIVISTESQIIVVELLSCYKIT